MRFALLVTAAPDQEAAFLAWRFADAALAEGHEIVRVFFAGAGVAHGNLLSTPPRDETPLTARWQRLQEEHDIELVVCVAAALRRGVVDDLNARSWELPAANLAVGFLISGLGQLAEAQLEADRLVTFPG
ncbi:sulfurtransferase complex subunit TusD [Amnimonas aquatica]|uniref:Sulfurtransferase complex subunit TusD n=1 Tax=Amnimonas aquatica TaxID=2094561 RepID=A0A2P6AS08_9GAMM|nr:sulfurtransferase complex subunit TusD [Amnimonas aquatica]PQA40073.1 sulfurtransferase complex subunit TusD [Amnimonas aquatica]